MTSAEVVINCPDTIHQDDQLSCPHLVKAKDNDRAASEPAHLPKFLTGVWALCVCVFVAWLEDSDYLNLQLQSFEIHSCFGPTPKMTPIWTNKIRRIPGSVFEGGFNPSKRFVQLHSLGEWNEYPSGWNGMAWKHQLKEMAAIPRVLLEVQVTWLGPIVAIIQPKPWSISLIDRTLLEILYVKNTGCLKRTGGVLSQLI